MNKKYNIIFEFSNKDKLEFKGCVEDLNYIKDCLNRDEIINLKNKKGNFFINKNNITYMVVD